MIYFCFIDESIIEKNKKELICGRSNDSDSCSFRATGVGILTFMCVCLCPEPLEKKRLKGFDPFYILGTEYSLGVLGRQ